jgi:hypothetical protein
LAWRDSAFDDALARGSRFSARMTARERRGDRELCVRAA